ncbi:MAG: hypothetical protein QME50_01100 [Candidatus Bathyarchaeota archaeon]|nr:hypothetical protein [Candidatus Bathyarchaeota archaeon]
MCLCMRMILTRNFGDVFENWLFVWEYPPALVGGLGTYAEYITREFVSMGNDVTVFTLNSGNLKTREIVKGVEVHKPLIVDASNVFPMFVIDDLKSGEPTFAYSTIFSSTTY